MKFLSFAAAAAALFAANAASATTLEVVSGPTGQRSQAVAYSGPLGQSFTAFDTNLSSVGFQFNALNPSNASTPFTLSLLSGSTLSGSALFTKTFSLPTSINSSTPSWFDIDITGWNVIAGQAYTFVLSTAGYRNGIIMGPEINLSTGVPVAGDAYAGGTALFSSIPYYYYPEGKPTPFCETTGMCDLNFRVTASTPAVPEPATWAMLVLGFGIVGSTLRRAKRTTIAFA